jgi:hypothetical protein
VLGTMAVLNSLTSQEDLAAAKAAAREAAAGAAAPQVTGPIWRLFHFTTAAEAVNFANIPPVQVAGQFGMTDDPAGGFDGYYFY